MKKFSKLLSAPKWELVISSIGILVLVVFSGLVLSEAAKAEVAITDNGEEQTVTTHADTVKELLNETGITLNKHDELSHNKNDAIIDGMHITYKTAHEVTVRMDGDKRIFYTTADTVGQFLKENDLTVTDEDEMSLAKLDDISGDQKLSIDKAFKVSINDGGEEKEIDTTGGTVEKVLKANGFTWDKSDKIKPGKNKEVNKNTSINIVRVETYKEEVEEPIAYETEKRNDSSLEKGKDKVIEAGKEGLVSKTFKITEENGDEVGRELIDKTVKQESENRIVAIGTKEKKQDLVTLSSGGSNDNSSANSNDNSNANSSSNGKTYSMKVTAYSANCNGCSGVTRTGINLNANPNKKVVAVDPSVIPLGTKVWVEGYGTAIAGDTGGAIKGHYIDIHVPTRAQANAFGTKYNVTVKVLD